MSRLVIYVAASLAVLALLVTGLYAAIVDPERIPQIGGNVDPCPADTTRLKAETGELSAGFVSDDNVHITFDDVYAAGPEPADRQSASTGPWTPPASRSCSSTSRAGKTAATPTTISPKG